jgi:flavin-dependent thymidylate synthase
MKVSLIAATPDALDVLIFTKNTRLTMHASGFDEVKAWPMEKKLSELEYMKNTIGSSFEFIDYVFMVEGVSRAFTHQLVRHRVGTSFAQQSQRTVDMSGFDFITGPTVDLQDVLEAFNDDVPASNMPMLDYKAGRGRLYRAAMGSINSYYQQLVRMGAAVDDARGLLPTNIATNIVFKGNLRTLAEMGLKRLCTKTQGEFQKVFKAMRAEVLRVHPWLEGHIEVHCAKYGTCMFPTFPNEKCKVKPIVFNQVTGLTYGGLVPVPINVIKKIVKEM